MKETISFNGRVSYTQQVSDQSMAARFMAAESLTAVVQIYLKGGSDAQRAELMSFIDSELLAICPLRRGRRQFIFCRCNSAFSDECILSSYDAVLKATLGPNTRSHARIYRKGGAQ